MTLSTLKTICAAYLGQATSALTVGGVDLFLVAANNARKNAEQLHDFEDASITATLSIDGVTGGALGSAVIAGNAGETLTDGGNTYYRNGEYGGYGFYLKLTDPASFLYYNAAHSRYVLADVLQPSALTDYAAPATAGTSPIGAFIGHGSFSDATIAQDGTATFSGIKSVTAVQRTNVDGTLEPLDFTSSTGAINRVRDQIAVAADYYFDQRYPSDRQLYTLGQDGTLIQRNNTIYIYPRPVVAGTPLAVTLQGYGWLRDYVAADLSSSVPTDFLVAYGSAFLQWSIILELNYLFKIFVPRVEGELSPPQQMKDEAWRDLLVWDNWRVDANSTSTR